MYKNDESLTLHFFHFVPSFPINSVLVGIQNTRSFFYNLNIAVCVEKKTSFSVISLLLLKEEKII